MKNGGHTSSFIRLKTIKTKPKNIVWKYKEAKEYIIRIEAIVKQLLKVLSFNSNHENELLNNVLI